MLRLLRRLHAILLLLSFALPLLAPALALAQGDAGLPACCRKGGKHHCAMAAEAMAAAAQRQSKPLWKQLAMRCPYSPAAASAHAPVQAAGAREASVLLWAGSHPAGVAQTESKWRMSRERSRQKRGPPQILL